MQYTIVTNQTTYVSLEIYHAHLYFASAAQEQNATPQQGLEILAVFLAAQSGDVKLPWSQSKAEKLLLTPRFEVLQAAVANHPTFVQQAVQWGLANIPVVFHPLAA